MSNIHLLPSGQNRLLVVFGDHIESHYWRIFLLLVTSNIHTNDDLNCEILLLNYTLRTLEGLHSFTPSVLYQHLQNENSAPKEKTVRLLEQTLLQRAKHRNDK
jgi:hypothetical protein